jgi:regulator of sigma E protease
MYLLLFILILVALIVVHEFGHFSVAKLFGIRVEEFGIGFPPRLLSVKRGETTYSINLLFFGGFVKIFGENAEGAKNPRSFAHKSRSVQALVIIAGIVMNLIFAWGILSLGYMVGMPTSLQHEGFGVVSDAHVTVVGVLAYSPANKSGIEAGDVLESVGTAILTAPSNMNADTTRAFIATHQDESMIVKVLREGEEKVFIVRAAEGLIPGRKALGVELDDVGVLRLPPHLALAEGAILSYHMTVSTAVGLATFFTQIARGVADFSSVAGPIGIAGIGAKAVSNGFSAAVTITALISINLALINILPIPGLDGGRLLIIGVEGATRRAVSPKITLGITIAGFAFLIGLMLLVSYHDIAKLVG